MEYAQKLLAQQIVFLVPIHGHAMLALTENTGMEENVHLVTQDAQSVNGQKFALFVILHINFSMDTAVSPAVFLVILINAGNVLQEVCFQVEPAFLVLQIVEDAQMESVLQEEVVVLLLAQIIVIAA